MQLLRIGGATNYGVGGGNGGPTVIGVTEILFWGGVVSNASEAGFDVWRLSQISLFDEDVVDEGIDPAGFFIFLSLAGFSTTVFKISGVTVNLVYIFCPTVIDVVSAKSPKTF